MAFDTSDPDSYRFDMLDGFDDEMEKDPLSEEQKEKIKKALIQGFIDPEDFNGVCFSSLRIGDTLTDNYRIRRRTCWEPLAFI